MILFEMVRELVKTAFRFVDGILHYDPILHDYFKENNIDFIEDLLELLVLKKYPEKLGITKNELEKKVSKLDFSKGFVLKM